MKAIFNNKRLLVFLLSAIFIVIAGMIAFSFIASKSIQGDWELVANPEISQATPDEISDSDRVYCTFSKPSKFGDGTYKTYYAGGVEEGTYKLSEKNGKDFINMGTAAYPGAFANDETAVQQQKARDILYSQVVTGLTTQITQEEIDRIAGSAGSAKYDDVIFTGSYKRVQDFYEVSEMSDGLPVVPPTQEKVEYYLQFTNMAATDIVNEKNGEIIGVKPAYKTITAYQVAVNAIMAGCPAEYMPICMAITRCFANGNFYKSLDSTHGWTPYVLVSGPLARQLGISYEDGMINEEANKLIGRFISLAMLNLAGYKIKENRMGTFGYMQPFCFAEDEQTAVNIG